jgi:hypothetical protein
MIVVVAALPVSRDPAEWQGRRSGMGKGDLSGTGGSPVL